MSNHIKTMPNRQKKVTRTQQIEAAQEAWMIKAKELVQEKAEIGFKDLSREEFLAIIPDFHYETAMQSQILDLQERYKAHLEYKNALWLEDTIVSEFNNHHAIIHIDQTYVLTEKTNTLGEQDFSLESRASFLAFYEDDRIICPFDNKERSKAEIWLKSPKKRKYKGIVFNPSTTAVDNNYYNIWKGFSKEAIQGDCSKYWTHVKNNICNGDEESYNYVRKWLSSVFQYPDRIHTAIVLQGSQGVGKNSFVEPLGVLLGSHYAPLSSISELISNFNYHLKNAVLIHANEAMWGGHIKDLGTVKAMITEEYCLVEGKGKDRIKLRNFKHVILSSNEDWPIRLDTDDRRFLVLKVSAQQKENHEYFKAIHDELINGGYEALLYDLLHEDLSNFNPRKLPSNANAFQIKLRSQNSVYLYIYEALCDGGFTIGSNESRTVPVWQSLVCKRLIYADYKLWCEANGEALQTNEQFGKAIKKCIVSIEDTRPIVAGIRQRSYALPTLRQAQEDFCKAFKIELPEQIFENYESLSESIAKHL